MASSNRIRKVAVVGASGHSGSFITEALLKTGKLVVTAITRVGSESKFPEGVDVKKVDYGKQETLVEALQGQDALVITLSGHTPEGTEAHLINAAGEAGVGWILPNEWSPDTANEALVNDVSVFKPKGATRQTIADLGKSSYIAVSTGFWYEWSLAIPPAYGFDLANRTVTFFDEGKTKISTTTWPQLGRAVAALLSLPAQAEGANKNGCLEDFKNKVVYVNSFTVSQRDMLDSAIRVTGTQESDWKITHEPSKERYASGIKEIGEGKRIGFAKMMYTRVFYPDGCGDFESSKGTLNDVLGLPKEDIDIATKVAIERSKGPAMI
ncbi:putative NmrA-like domain-containing protein [Seiridium cardinale]